MSDTTLHTVLINRMWIGVLQDYFRMKGISNLTIKRNNHDELKKYESVYHKKLTKVDAIVVSPLTENEINKIINGYDTNKELLNYQNEKNEKILQQYYRDYGKDE